MRQCLAPRMLFEPDAGLATLMSVETGSLDTPLTTRLPAASLIDASLGGDGDAFRRLVEPYLATALRAATLLIGSEADAADAVQDALLSAWGTLGHLRDPATFPAWFRKIVVRAAMRRAKARTRIVQLDLDQPGSPALEPSLQARDLARAFALLSPDDRLSLTLRHLWEMSTREAAELLGIPEGTVKSRTHHALERLRAAYEAEERR